MDLMFQVPIQYCFLQPWVLLPLLVTSTTGHCFHFDSAFSSLLKLFLHSSPVAYWTPTDLGNSSFSIMSFCLFILHGVLKARLLKWFAIPFPYGPFPVDHILSELSTMTCPSWVTLHYMAHSFIESDKAVV